MLKQQADSSLPPLRVGRGRPPRLATTRGSTQRLADSSPAGELSAKPPSQPLRPPLTRAPSGRLPDGPGADDHPNEPQCEVQRCEELLAALERRLTQWCNQERLAVHPLGHRASPA